MLKNSLKLKIVGINSGIGVSLYPFKNQNILGNLETRSIFHMKDDKQWNLNFTNIPLYKKPENLPIANWKNCDLLISSPDCGSSSILRLSRAKEYKNQKHSKTLQEFFYFTNKIKPKFFYFENLPGLLKDIPEKEFKKLLKNRYHLLIFIDPVSAWGNSQIHRKRLIIMGISIKIDKSVIRKIGKRDKFDYLPQCKEIYGDLGENKTLGDNSHIRENLNEYFAMYGGNRTNGFQAKILWNTLLKDKKRWSVFDRTYTTAPGVYRNLDNDYPNTARKSDRQYDQYGNALSPRQLARVQGIPDSFKLYIDTNNKKYTLNKARAAVTKTPPMQIAQWVLNRLLKTQKIWNKN